MEPITRTGLPLGAMCKASFVAREVRLDPGDRMILYTDGVTEARNAAGDLFGEEALRGAVLTHAGRGPASLVRHLLSEVQRFRAHTPKTDDTTLLVVERTGPPVS